MSKSIWKCEAEIEYEHPGLKDRIVKSLGLEGGDGVGKNEATLAVFLALQEADILEIDGVEYSADDFEIMYTSYPSYFTPFGQLIKCMNNRGFDRFRQHMEEEGRSVDMDTELALRMSLYSLDRLFSAVFMGRFASLSDKKIIHISDRSPYSQIVTIVLTLMNHGRSDLIQEYLSRITDADQEFIGMLNWQLITLFKSEEEIGEFADGKSITDDLERADVQRQATRAYEILSSMADTGVKSVHTQIGPKEFRKREDIARDVLSAAGIKIKRKKLGTYIPNALKLFSREKYISCPLYLNDHPSKPPYIFNPSSVYYFGLRKKASPFMSDQHITALEELNMVWEMVTFAGDKGRRFLMGTNPRKDILDGLERKWAFIFADFIANLGLDDEAKRYIPDDVSNATRRLLGDYSGGLLRDFVWFLEEETGYKEPFDRMPHGASRIMDIMSLGSV